MAESKDCLLGLAPRRKAAGFTQEGLAVALQVSRPLLAAWETGIAWPSARRLPRIAQLLGCSIEELFQPPDDSMISQEGGEAPCRPTAEISTKAPDALPD